MFRRRRRTAEDEPIEDFPRVCDAVFADRLAAHGFVPEGSREGDRHSWATRTYRSGERYVEVHASTDYRDVPPSSVSVSIGEGSSSFPEADWNRIAVGQLGGGRYGWLLTIPSIAELPGVLAEARRRLEEEAADFLAGDTTRLRADRARLTRRRKPYTIHRPDESGRYRTTVDPESEELKRRFEQE